ncbi:MBL fold metallo-hydrolase [Staphylococcus chromogenes]|uniref:MBL fold metallo-hydrolase n=1 Tax=Staphylococcus chromogenes TaxID=46126 RepID=UPI000D19D755|nr:MBL fold metallo-hydrolase [Staphylococcus chromogenes]MDT0670927.1 MBL fold metallo-hydrolase [Staphylococcus chromogenes]MDT0673119.1 MBL fold metallo-hydrolase [Staphylococcus chromogenes]PTF96259.1 hydroxyacylglutathione hydrolase [Staphylococcus chromogenes]PTG77911.1 hydroxyacylglutathione hydrolase [Staphylococcus chromogenes]WAG29614.1 MBL fold metallo-hydrolase [Staphylococcus chromogenes]
MEISYLPLGFVSTNTYFVTNDSSLLLIDPAGESHKIINKIKELNKPLVAILLTHAHFDHIAALDDILAEYDVPVYMHENEIDFLQNPEKNGSAKFKEMGLPIITSKASPKTISEGKIALHGFDIDVLFTPGHSPGSLSYVFKDFAVVGDTLFNNGIGRTDLYQGDYENLVDSIKEKLFELDETMPIYPGHGASTTIENEYFNPYLNG